jgi:hypothetical protein
MYCVMYLETEGKEERKEEYENDLKRSAIH